MVNILGQMGRFIKENGKIIRWMEGIVIRNNCKEEKLYGKMGKNILESIRMIKKKGEGYLYGRMEENMMVNGRMENNM